MHFPQAAFMSDFIYFRQIISSYCGALRGPFAAVPFHPALPHIFAVEACLVLAHAKTAPFAKASLRVIMPVRVPFVMSCAPELGLAAVLRLSTHICCTN